MSLDFNRAGLRVVTSPGHTGPALTHGNHDDIQSNREDRKKQQCEMRLKAIEAEGTCL